MKKLFSLLLCICLLFAFIIPSFADVPYGSINEDSSQAKILIELMINDPAFDAFAPWFCYRSSETEYVIYFTIDTDEQSGIRYRYYSTSSGYNNSWNYVREDEVHVPDISSGSYTFVGNIVFSLGSQIYRNYLFHVIIKYCVVLITFVICFFVFRIRRRSYI